MSYYQLQCLTTEGGHCGGKGHDHDEQEGSETASHYYKYLSWLFPVIRIILPNIITTMSQVGQAMIQAAEKGYEKNVIEVKDIKILSERASKTS